MNLLNLFLCLKLSEKSRIIKNLISFTIVCFLILTSSSSIASIQSVLNKAEGLGITSQFVTFCAQILSCLVVPQLFKEFIGYKGTMVVIGIFNISYIAVNMYPRWYTLMPTSVFFGIAQSLVWTTIGMYISELSQRFSAQSRSLFNHTQIIFFGIFSASYSISYIVGNLLVGGILQTNEINRNSNFSYSDYCGASNCPSYELPASTSKPSTRSLYLLCSIFIIFCVLSILITILFVDDLNSTENDEDETKDDKKITKIKLKKKFSRLGEQLKTEFVNIWDLLKSVDLYLLLPITLYTGFEITFVWNEFNRSFVTCIFNIKYIGWSNSVLGATGVVLSIIFGYITKYVTQQSLFVFILMVSIANIIFMLTWIPNPTQLYVIFLLAASFGTTRAYYIGQIRGLYGINFPTNHSAHSLASLFQASGFAISVLVSLFFCTYIKLYVLLIVTFLSLICYLIMIGKKNYQELHQPEEIVEEERRVSLISEIQARQSSNTKL